jgi:RNA polymerase sigma-70 factor (ECF subfamily)
VRRRALEVRIAPTGREAGDDAADAIVGRVHLVRAWRSLSPRDREALALVAFDGLTGEQAALVLGCRRTAFAMRLNRARTRLRAALDAEGHTARPDHLVLLKESS